MNELGLLHLPEPPMAEALGPRSFRLVLRTAKEDHGLRVIVHYGNKYDFPMKRHVAEMKVSREDRLFSYFEAVLELDDPRLGYVFEILEGDRSLYYSEEGLKDHYDFKVAYKDFFQCPFIYPETCMEVPNWVDNAVFYQIFVDRFRMGDLKKDRTYIKLKWGGKPNNKSHAGGDLRGIILSLDYLKALGINALYLTPIFLSPSYHKYDIVDYFTIDPHFGTEADLVELIEEAHKRGMRIVLDAVFNHISNQSRYFLDVLEKGRKSDYFDMFYIHGDKVDVVHPNYDMFSLCPYMPKINVESKTGRELLLKVTMHYLELGIDGWRLDVSDEVPHGFWKWLRKEVKGRFPEALILGEVWHHAGLFLKGDEFDGVMNYPFTYIAVDYLAEKRIGAKDAAARLNRHLMENRRNANRAMLNLLDSHDTYRFLTLANKNTDALLCALALLVFYPGMSCLYYGTELPLEGGYDPDSRRCFDFEEAQKETPFRKTLMSLLALRKGPALSQGTCQIKEENGLLVLRRTYGGEELELLINSTQKGIQIDDKGLITAHNLSNKTLSPDGLLIRRIEK